MTKTSKFGTTKREGHDSSEFYNRKIYHDLVPSKPKPEELRENPVPDRFLDKVIVGDAREVLKEMPDRCVHLMVTSPPYNVGKEYDEDLTLGDYLDFIEEIMKEVYRVLVWGGRVCFNVADLGRKPYIPLHAYLIERFEKIGFLMRGIVIWYKGDSVANSNCAWGRNV
jgi:site-specific DNA-methyltransferase (adenine-specific)